MPELPEVETTKRGIEPHIKGTKVKHVIIRQPQLRWLILEELIDILPGQKIQNLSRRSKYLLLHFQSGCLLIHLGMSGHLRVLPQGSDVGKHDHFELILSNNKLLRLTDPRRFGAVLWIEDAPEQYPLLQKLGPEPLTDDFNADYLYQNLRKRNKAIKLALMDNHIVVGVGNIYANEALFMAGIRPDRKANTISKARITKLVAAIKQILSYAIEQGGTTLKDFYGADGKQGYFQLSLSVYGRAGEPCQQCQKSLTLVRLGQRATVFCKHCQK